MCFTKRVLVVGLLFALVVPAFSEGKKRLLAYYPDWAKDQAPAYNAERIPYSKLTHILHAFLLLDPKGNGSLQVDPELIEPALNRRAHEAGVKVILSMGGADESQSAAFARIAASARLRSLLARNIHAFLLKYHYDGIDIDWEVPNAPDDTTHCTQLMEALRRELPRPRWLVSMAISADPRNYGTGFDVPALSPIVDFFNVMTYDFSGPWMSYAGLNSPLFQDNGDPEQAGSLKTSMDLYNRIYGVPRAKLNIGTAFYGYEFDNVQNLWNYCPNSDCGAASSWNYGTYIKHRVNAKGWARHWDAKTQSPYLLYQGPGGKTGFITYDDPYSTALKTYYVLGKRDFGGMFMWDLSGDYDGKSQDLLHAMHEMKEIVEHARH